MSKSTVFAIAAAAAVASLPALAAPQVPDDGFIPNFAVNSDILCAWHGGVQGFAATRNVENKNTGRVTEMDARRFDAYVGYDVTRWMTVYALGGVLSAKDKGEWLESDTETVWGAGVWLSLLDDDQLDVLSTVSRYRLTAGVEVSRGDPNDLAWTQIDGFLTFELVNDIYLTELIFPTQVGVYAGPVFSKIDLDGYDQEGDNDWGFTLGLDLRFANGMYAQGAYDWFSDDSVLSFSAGFRF
ncbi:MAG: hypothetical protein IJ678_09110 [Kiritimatiellae bacterium]|nr:hypothetical protein [Kiritimatiellia bacterium]MBR1836851.1 hypothetical protein [Kiritimatiellia bacterium]